MAEKNHTAEFVWNVHSYINEYIRHADSKAELVIGWTSALMGVLTASSAPKILGWSSIGKIYWSGFALLVVAFILAFATVRPRLWTSQKAGFIFWDSILGHRTNEAYAKALNGCDEAKLYLHVTEHLFDISKIAQRKYLCVGWSIVFAFTGSLISGACYMIAAVPSASP